MTPPTFSRRDFLGSAAAATGAALFSTSRLARAATAPSSGSFSFVLLGDLHFDRLEHHHPEQIRVEPNFSPANEAERRAVYDAEKKFVPAFDYADLPGYAVVTVAGAQVTARMFAGTGRERWRTVDLTALARA